MRLSSFCSSPGKPFLKSPCQRNQKSEDDARQQKLAIKRQDDIREAEVISHENKHAAVAGGNPVYQYNSRGRIVGGHVNVGMNPNSKTSLETAIKAAEAPGGDMSAQDQAVAASAKGMLKALESRSSEGKAQLAMQNPKKAQKV